MIVLLNYSMKIVATILLFVLAFISIAIGLILWDKRFMNGEHYWEWVWGKQTKKQ